MHYCIVAFALFFLSHMGMALPAKQLSSRAKSKTSSSSGSQSCTITNISQLPSCKSSCSQITIGDLNVPAGQTLDLTKLKDGTNVVFSGKITWGYQEWKGPLVSISGNNIHCVGKNGSVLDGNGKRWWDGLGGNGGKIKPKFFFVHGLTNSVIQNIKIKNSPVHMFSVSGSHNVQFSGISIDNKDGDTQGGHNTDAFDVSNSSDITVLNSKIYNQDDCLAVNSGTNIKFSNCYCSGGHGISIGSVGNRENNDVDTVTISDCTIVDSENGVRIKTVAGAPSGKVTNVSYKNIKLQNVHNGITIRQDYTNKGYTGTATGGIPITNLSIENVTGNINAGGIGIYINCAKGACSNWAWQNNILVDETGYAAKDVCINAPVSI